MTSGFEEAAWLFNSHISNRGCIRQDFNEAALLWKATRVSRGSILEIGRRHGGSTVLLLMAGEGRHGTSIDLDPCHLPECDEYFSKPEIARRLTLITGNSRIPISGSFGFMFFDGDQSYEGVKADICAQWSSLAHFKGIEPTIVFHDAVENTQAHNSGSTHKTGVQNVCNELIACGTAQRLEAAGSSLWMKKLADLPASFRDNG